MQGLCGSWGYSEDEDSLLPLTGSQSSGKRDVVAGSHESRATDERSINNMGQRAHIYEKTRERREIHIFICERGSEGIE